MTEYNRHDKSWAYFNRTDQWKSIGFAEEEKETPMWLKVLAVLGLVASLFTLMVVH